MNSPDQKFSAPADTKSRRRRLAADLVRAARDAEVNPSPMLEAPAELAAALRWLSGVMRSRGTEQDQNARLARRLHADYGMSPAAIAKELGVPSRRTVRDWISGRTRGGA